jgi:hypothetical protein
MIIVVVEWNTDADGSQVDTSEERVIENLDQPRSLYGPFESFEAAQVWMNDALENDKEVFEMYSCEYDVPEHWTVNNPKEYPFGYKEVDLEAG